MSATLQNTLTIRVRYPEVDAMGYLHHSRFLQYFELGRVELLRSMGISYADLERKGIFFVVTKADIRFKAPARYDEELTLLTKVVKQTHVRYDHAYELRRGETLLAEGTTTIACVGRDGQVRKIPDELAGNDEPAATATPISTNGTKPDLVDIDWPCVNCTYNLRLLPVDGKCPECGEPISRSVDDDEYLIYLAREIADKSLGEIRTWLRSTNRYSRSAAAYSLAMKEGADEAIPDLVAAAGDAHADVRWWAISTLVAIDARSEPVISALQRARDDSDADVRDAAIKGLAKKS